MIWVIGLLSLDFLVIIHEFGHFFASKLLGVKVETMSVGFGPVLLHKKIKGTDYRLSLLPLGGYCGTKGEKDFQEALDKDLPELTGDKDSLYGIHPLKRALVFFAGPFINFIFGILAFTIINLIGFTYKTYSNKIVIPEDEYVKQVPVAKEAGLLTGDKIIYINNKKIETFDDIIMEVSTRADEDIIIKVDRNGEILSFNVHTLLNKEDGSGKIGITCDPNSIVTKNSPKYNLFTALIQGFKDTINLVYQTVKSLRLLFKGINFKTAVGGPIKMTGLLGSGIQSGFSSGAKIGFYSLFNLLAIISISLCVMNLLPIPVLDGGGILIALIESITRKKIRPKVQYYIQLGGAIILILIFLFVTYSDILFLLNK